MEVILKYCLQDMLAINGYFVRQSVRMYVVCGEVCCCNLLVSDN